MGYAEVKKKYTQAMEKEAMSQIDDLKVSEISGEVVFNKMELHDARILIGVLSDLLLKHKIITKKELEEDIASAYSDELKQLKAVRK